MCERIQTTVTVHDRLDPECIKHEGQTAPWGFLWLFKCYECRQHKKAKHAA